MTAQLVVSLFLIRVAILKCGRFHGQSNSFIWRVQKGVQDVTNSGFQDEAWCRSFTKKFQREAVAMLLDEHSATSVAERLSEKVWCLHAAIVERVAFLRR